MTPSPRLRGEGRGEGLSPQLGQLHFENSVDVLDNVIVPDSNYAVAQCGQIRISSPIRDALAMGADRLLADEFEPSNLPIANPAAQHCFRWREGASQRSRTLSPSLAFPAHDRPLTPTLSPQAAELSGKAPHNA